MLNKIASNNIIFLILFLFSSCASKKDIHYFQNSDTVGLNTIKYENPNIQVNDILNINVSALIPETALPYNNKPSLNVVTSDIEVKKLEGYLVSSNGDITFPILGKINILHKTTTDLEILLKKLLEEGGHIINPVINVRILNSKVTILGEVNTPGTYSFTGQNITLPQALGYAGDLTINGIRNDILLIREEDSKRTITHLDLTKTDWFNSPYYFLKQNDVIVIKQNKSKIKSAGFIGTSGAILSIASILLSTIILITR